ncbi:MAG: pro-sigmaK processing inhibitor BofA family protein, partial [Vallitaleaceae bacterium]|nr:pro-sigmaK processing inhibitor BofA family protein [Vallitaleaceae bacterium]
VLLKGILGLGAIYLANLALANWQIAIGLNACNGLIIGILGISGFILLYVLALVDIFLLK